jgi:GNAT superfamily N-acetyltransferase
MNRGPLIIRDATAADMATVERIAQTAVRTDGRLTSGAKLMLESPTGPTPDFGAVLASPEFRTILAVDPASDEIAGLAVMSEDLFSALIGRPAVFVHYLLVLDDRRQRGVGREMLADITRFAEEIAAESVVVSLWTEAREVNRYFAKVGFTPVAQRRIAPVSTLRRTLGLGQTVAARETARRRLQSGP